MDVLIMPLLLGMHALKVLQLKQPISLAIQRWVSGAVVILDGSWQKRQHFDALITLSEGTSYELSKPSNRLNILIC